MTVGAESVGSGWGLPETDVFAERISGSMAPLPPNTTINRAIEEALKRFGPGLEDTRFPTSFSNTQIADWLERDPSPPLAVMLIAAHKLQTDERNPGTQTHDPIGNLALKAIGRAHKGQDKLFGVVARRVYRNYGVGYNNNPRDDTGPEERSLAAWLLADSLVELYEEGQVWPGCESLADNITMKLLGLYVQRIRISPPRRPNDSSPPGTELRNFCERLNNRMDIAESVGIFLIEAETARRQRTAEGQKALHIKQPTTKPSPTAVDRMRFQARKYQETTYKAGPDLYDIATKYVEQYKNAQAAGDSQAGPLLDDLIEVWMVARDCLATNPPAGMDQQGFRAVCELVEWQHGMQVVGRVLEEIPAIAAGTAQLVVQKLGYYLLFEQQPTFRGQSRPELENALYAAALLWYRQSGGQYTSRVYKQRQGKFGTFEDIKYTLRFSEMKGIKREAGELMIRTYLYQATALGCEVDDPINNVRLWALQQSFGVRPKPTQQLLLHELPPACAQMFSLKK